MPESQTGPDLVIIGASRAGSTALANHLVGHPEIVLPSVKEPNYYSVYHDRGAAWYRSLFPDTPGLRWLDASTTYSYPQFPGTLERLAEEAPQAQYVYLVREPIERAFSQFVHEAMYLEGNTSARFADHVTRDSHYLAPSRYALILDTLARTLPRERVLVVPFEVATRRPQEVAEVLLPCLGLDPASVAVIEEATHRNERVVMRSPLLARGFNAVRDTRAYARFRARIGDSVVRRLRSVLTSGEGLPTLDAALGEVDQDGRLELGFVEAESREAVAAWLEIQDSERGTSWRAAAGWCGATAVSDQ